MLEAEQLVAMESKCDELRKAADDAEMVNCDLRSIIFDIYRGCHVLLDLPLMELMPVCD